MANRHDSRFSRPESVATFATGVSLARSVAHSIRSLDEVSRHMQQRQIQRGIPDSLIRETVIDGLVTDQRNSRHLHVSDNIIVISEDRDGRLEGITTFRHELLDVWRADHSTTQDADVKDINTAYFFFQVLFIQCTFFKI